MPIKTIASVVIAALILTGTAYPAPQISGQGDQLPQSQTTVTAPTQTEAEAIALEHAGFTEADVTYLRSEPDLDDRVPHWDVEWRSGDWEYDYEIHKDTGEILFWHKEYDPVTEKPRQTQPPVTEPPATQAPEAKTDYLTSDEALAIALKHAGLTRNQISRLERELDRDDRSPQWELEFQYNGWEYSYDIHAETGSILDWEKELDD